MAHHYQRNKKSSPDNGRERALEHIRQAKEFSLSIGGYDKDVKEYFFNLPEDELNAILSIYGEKYGDLKEEYARNTFLDWRRGKVQMSGLVAKRLFDLLPPRMPEKKKYDLAENIWKHFGPSSNSTFCVSPTADIDDVCATVTEKLDRVVTEYGIPENVKKRFNWLSSGDIAIQEKILNHIRQLQKELCIEKIRLELPMLQTQILNVEKTTLATETEIFIHKHKISIKMDKNYREGIIENVIWPNKSFVPVSNKPNKSLIPESVKDKFWDYLFGLGMIIAVVYFWFFS